MKIYYILNLLNYNEKIFFDNSLKDINSISDIDNLIQDKYYRVGEPYDINIKTNNSFILQTWIFIKYIWINYGIKPKDINWIYYDNLVILNEDLWLFKGGEWLKISEEKDVCFFSSLYTFSSGFWYLWKKISALKSDFPKLIFPNDNRDYVRDDKLKYIINIYEKRNKLIGDFMLPLFSSVNIDSIKNVLKLRKQVTGKSDFVMKGSWRTDNGKHVRLININEFLEREDLVDHIYLKYLQYVNEYSGVYYFVDFYDIEKEYRLYISKNTRNNTFKIYSLKEKNNITTKEELYTKSNLSTGNNLKVNWILSDDKKLGKEFIDNSKYIFKANNFTTGVIEYIKTTNGELRFLEINNLGGSLMFRGEDEKNISNRLTDMWDNLFYKNNI